MARGPLAGAAGPGKFSVRTDGMQLPSAAYGEGVETAAIQAGAPLAKTADVRGMPASEVRETVQETITPLYAPSQRADEPITAGIPLGAGPGPEVLGIKPQPVEKYSDTLVKLLPFDETGEIAVLYQDFLARGM